MTIPARVYYFPLDDQQEEGSPIEISLKEEGGVLVADLSRLPAGLRATLERQGASGPMHQDRLFPKDGISFLEALLSEASAYRRFRQSPDSI
jgi:hypothetical protein